MAAETGGVYRWSKSNRSPLYLGLTDDILWIRFAVKAGDGAMSEWVLNIDWPFFDMIEMHVYLPKKKEWHVHYYPPRKNGERNSSIKGHLPYAFRFSCPEHESREIYLRLHSYSIMLIPIRIWQADAYHRMSLNRNLFLGLFFGILIAMFCYNTSLFLFTKDSSYAYYSVYVFSIILYALSMSGAGTAYLWKNSLWFQANSYGLFSSFSFMMAALFIRRFLELPTVGGWPLYLSNIIAAYWAVMSILFAVQNSKWLMACENIGALVTCIVGLVVPIILWARGSISAKYLTIAWTLLILSTFALMAGLIGMIDFNPIVQNSQRVGFILEVILLSLALAERINRERAEKEAAQELSVRFHEKAVLSRERELKAQAETLAVEQEAKAELRHQVDLRTQELSSALTALEAANKELGMQSRTDALTQLYNRRHFNEMFEIEFKRAVRMKLPLAVILGDIDHFKAINDTYGHRVGDECLQVVASCWKSQMIRAGDLVARYGGEEFVAILPGIQISDAKIVAERIRQSVEDSRYTYGGKHVRLTISLGISGLVLLEDKSPGILLERSDEAMYNAKKQGRNRIAVSRINTSR